MKPATYPNWVGGKFFAENWKSFATASGCAGGGPRGSDFQVPFRPGTAKTVTLARSMSSTAQLSRRPVGSPPTCYRQAVRSSQALPNGQARLPQKPQDQPMSKAFAFANSGLPNRWPRNRLQMHAQIARRRIKHGRKRWEISDFWATSASVPDESTRPSGLHQNTGIAVSRHSLSALQATLPVNSIRQCIELPKTDLNDAVPVQHKTNAMQNKVKRPSNNSG